MGIARNFGWIVHVVVLCVAGLDAARHQPARIPPTARCRASCQEAKERWRTARAICTSR